MSLSLWTLMFALNITPKQSTTPVLFAVPYRVTLRRLNYPRALKYRSYFYFHISIQNDTRTKSFGSTFNNVRDNQNFIDATWTLSRLYYIRMYSRSKARQNWLWLRLFLHKWEPLTFGYNDYFSSKYEDWSYISWIRHVYNFVLTYVDMIEESPLDEGVCYINSG